MNNMENNNSTTVIESKPVRMKSFSVVRQVVETSDTTMYVGMTRKGQQTEVVFNPSQMARNVIQTKDNIVERKNDIITRYNNARKARLEKKLAKITR